MSKTLRYAVRILVLAAVAATLPYLASTPEGGSGPYLSALSDLAAPSVAAAPPGACNHQACGQAPSGLKFRCVDAAVDTNCKAVKGGTDCSITAC
jgi:hypothetical protein